MKLFFVGGAPKSGTTWVQRMLDAHPTVRCVGELHLVDVLAYQIQQGINLHASRMQFHNETIFSNAAERARLGAPFLGEDEFWPIARVACDAMLTRVETDEATTHLGDKTPNNVNHFTTLQRLYPEARFIHIFRDGRDVITSGWHFGKRTSPEWLEQNYVDFYDYVFKVSRQWAHAVSLGVTFDGPAISFRYEDLLEDPERIRPVLRFLDVDDSDEAMEPVLEAAKPSKGGKHFRKGAAGDWQNLFDDRAIAIYEEEAGVVHKELGYD